MSDKIPYGEVIPFIPLENMSDAGLIEHYRRAEDNAEQAIEYIKFVGGVMQGRSVSKYADFHDVFPDDPAS